MSPLRRRRRRRVRGFMSSTVVRQPVSQPTVTSLAGLTSHTCAAAVKQREIDSRPSYVHGKKKELTRLHSSAAALCSSRWRKQCVHLLLLKMFGENLRHSTFRLPIVAAGCSLSSRYATSCENKKHGKTTHQPKFRLLTQAKKYHAHKKWLHFDFLAVFLLKLFDGISPKQTKKQYTIESKIKLHLTEIKRK